MKRSFPIGVILTGTTGVNLCPENFGQFHDLCTFLAGESVGDTGLAFAKDWIKNELLKQYPYLPEKEELPQVCLRWDEYLERCKLKYGEELEIASVFAVETET